MGREKSNSADPQRAQNSKHVIAVMEQLLKDLKKGNVSCISVAAYMDGNAVTAVLPESDGENIILKGLMVNLLDKINIYKH